MACFLWYLHDHKGLATRHFLNSDLVTRREYHLYHTGRDTRRRSTCSENFLYIETSNVSKQLHHNKQCLVNRVKINPYVDTGLYLDPSAQ